MSNNFSPLVLDDSESLIENRPNCINSPSSLKSINSYLKLFSSVNTNNHNPQMIFIPNKHSKPQLSSKQSMKNQSCGNDISKGVLLNPYISPSIKIKINELIADSNIAPSSYGRYRLYSNKASCQTTCLTKTAKKPSMPFNTKSSFTNVSISNNTKDSSALKITQMKQKFEKTLNSSSINQLSIFYSSRNNQKIKPLFSLKHSQPGNLLNLKKKLFINDNDEEINSFQKEFRAFKKVSCYHTNTNSNINTKTNFDFYEKNYKLASRQTLIANKHK